MAKSKKEISSFVAKYNGFKIHFYDEDKINADIVIDSLINCKDFEKPDGYCDKNHLIIEHFQADAFDKGRKGSTFNIQIGRINREEENKIQNAKNNVLINYEEESIYAIDAQPSLGNYLKNVKNQFEKHAKQIKSYRSNLFKKTGVNTEKFKVLFIIDSTNTSVYLDEKGLFCVLATDEFKSLWIKYPDVNYCLLGVNCNNCRHLFLLSKESIESNNFPKADEYRPMFQRPGILFSSFSIKKQ